MAWSVGVAPAALGPKAGHHRGAAGCVLTATQRRPLEADRSGVSLRGLGKIEAGRISRPRPSTVRRNCSGSRSARVFSIEDEELILRAGVVSPADRGRYGACGVLGAMFGVEEQLLARTQVHR
jgi:hypothetical protein